MEVMRKWCGVASVEKDETLTDEKYRKILKKNLFQSARKLWLGSNFIFQHDNDPKDQVRIVSDWLNVKRLSTRKHNTREFSNLILIEL